MNDIIGPSSPRLTTKELNPHKEVGVDRREPTKIKRPGYGWLSKTLEFLVNAASAAGSVISKLSSERSYLKIVQPSRMVIHPKADLSNQVHTPDPIPEIKITKKSLKQSSKDSLKKTKEYSKAGAGKIKSGMKTTTGKVAAINIATVLILVVLASNYLHKPINTEASQAQVASNQIRKYLPVQGNIVMPDPFNERALANQHKQSTPLYAWLTPWNIDSFQENKSLYQSVSAFWATVQENGIDITPKAAWDSWQKYKAIPSDSKQQSFLTVTGDPNYTAIALSNPDSQSQHIAKLLAVVQEQGFDGIDIDYEALTRDNHDLFTEFVRNLTVAFHAANKKVAVTLEARIANQNPMDWHTVSQLADEIRIMAYDYHASQTAFPGPIAPIGWLKEIMDYCQAVLDINKVVIGVGNYGYDWIQPDDGQTDWVGTGISFEQAMKNAQDKQSPIIRAVGIDDRGYDIGSIPMYTYLDSDNRRHNVWFEDNESLQSKMDLISQYQVKGVIFWSVGIGDKSFWQNWQKQ